MGLTNKEIFQGYHVAGACVMSPTYFGLILEENSEQAKFNKEGGVKVKICVQNLERPKDELLGVYEF